MGLNFTHCNARWSYGGFHVFRTRIANQIGISLNEMDGFGGDKSWDKINDDIELLLNHSDCDGELTPEECRKVAPRLRELVKDWPDDDYDKQNALELAKGMELVAQNNENLEFS